MNSIVINYAKCVNGCLLSKIICVEHYTLISQRVSPVFQIIHLKTIHTSTDKLYRIQAVVYSFKILQS